MSRSLDFHIRRRRNLVRPLRLRPGADRHAARPRGGPRRFCDSRGEDYNRKPEYRRQAGAGHKLPTAAFCPALPGVG